MLIRVLLFALLLGGCATGGGQGMVNVPHLALRDINGRTHYLSDTIGRKVTVMTFWATWCMPCRQELAVLQEMFVKHAGEGLEVLAIAVDGPETAGRVRPFVKQSGWTFTVLLDSETRATALYNPRKQMPMLHIFNREGRIVYSHTTFQPSHAPELKDQILKALEREEPDVPVDEAEGED
jgi:peroxiredoxin